MHFARFHFLNSTREKNLDLDRLKHGSPSRSPFDPAAAGGSPTRGTSSADPPQAPTRWGCQRRLHCSTLSSSSQRAVRPWSRARAPSCARRLHSARPPAGGPRRGCSLDPSWPEARAGARAGARPCLHSRRAKPGAEDEPLPRTTARQGRRGRRAAPARALAATLKG